MRKNRPLAGSAVLISGALLLGLATGFGTQEQPTSSARFQGSSPGTFRALAEDLIEVHGPKTAYVPTTAKYVKYDGAVRRIVEFSETLEEGDDCPCPRCCDGRCYVIIFTDPMTPGGPLRVPYILWLSC